MAQIKVGQVAPTAILESVNGETVSLADAWRDGRQTLLIYLRHLA
jgi:peroxiredoxin